MWLSHLTPTARKETTLMLALFDQFGKWLTQAVRHPQPTLTLPSPSASFLLTLVEAELPASIRACPVALKYHRLLHELDWAHFPERDASRAWPGPAPIYPRASFVAAYLVKLDAQQRYLSDLRQYLLDHPALARLLGFDPMRLPSRKQFGRVLRQLDNAALQFLLDATLRLIAAALPPADRPTFGDTVALDTKHILAWVKENNPKTVVKDRYDKTRQPRGDPDCKLGVKSRANRPPETELPTPTWAKPKPTGAMPLACAPPNCLTLSVLRSPRSCWRSTPCPSTRPTLPTSTP
jgi:hypothetical protein